jgi:cation diffusion facilitator CzcD-associated flavoprotein CzcO
MLSGSELNQFLFSATEGLMRQRLNENPHLIDKLIPKFEIGCRRLSPGDGYLEAMQQPNAKWCFEEIKEVTKNGIQTASGEEEFDLIVCATGFDTTFIPKWNLVGRDGRRLDEEWKEVPEAYFSICTAATPNYFMFAGPNFPIGHGSIPQAMSWIADYMLKWIKKMAREDIKWVFFWFFMARWLMLDRSIAVNDSVVRNWNRRAQGTLKRTVWSRGCNAWYNNGEVVTAMYPGSVLHFKGKSLHIVVSGVGR